MLNTILYWFCHTSTWLTGNPPAIQETYPLSHSSFPGGTSGKELTCQYRRCKFLIPGSGRYLGVGNGNPLQSSWKIPCIEEPSGL